MAIAALKDFGMNDGQSGDLLTVYAYFRNSMSWQSGYAKHPRFDHETERSHNKVIVGCQPRHRGGSWGGLISLLWLI